MNAIPIYFKNLLDIISNTQNKQHPKEINCIILSNLALALLPGLAPGSMDNVIFLPMLPSHYCADIPRGTSASVQAGKGLLMNSFQISCATLSRTTNLLFGRVKIKLFIFVGKTEQSFI